MNLALTTVGNIIRKYKKYSDDTANLPKIGRPRKINERTSRWISRNVQINAFINRSENKTDLEGAGINVSKDTISRALYRTGFHLRSPRKEPFPENQTCQRPIKVCRNLWKENMQFWEKGIWSNETKVKLFGRNTATSVWQKIALSSRSTRPSPQLSLGVVTLWYGDAFHPRALVSY